MLALTMAVMNAWAVPSPQDSAWFLETADTGTTPGSGGPSDSGDSGDDSGSGGPPPTDPDTDIDTDADSDYDPPSGDDDDDDSTGSDLGCCATDGTRSSTILALGIAAAIAVRRRRS